MSGSLSRHGSCASPPSDAERSDCINLGANSLFGSNAVYLPMRRWRWPGRRPSTLFGPGPISRIEREGRVERREERREEKREESWGMMKSR